MILHPLLTDLPPPSELRLIVAQMPSSFTWALTTNDKTYVWLFDWPHNAIADWQQWRSTVFEIDYRATYTLRYALVKAKAYFQDPSKHIRLIYHNGKFNCHLD